MTLILPDTFIQLADGKLNGQKAFMTGALKVKGNIMLAVSPVPPSTIVSKETSVWITELKDRPLDQA